MSEMKLTKSIVVVWLQTVEPNKQFHYKETLNGEIAPGSFGNLRKIYFDLVAEGLVKSSGYRDGYYTKIEVITPIRGWEGVDADKFYDFRFPRGHGGDGSEFGFEDYMSVSEGDLIIVGGVSNAGKTAFILNILGENVDTNSCVLMGNEYATVDKKVTAKFKRRMLRMNWVEWVNGTGHFKFDLLPVRSNYEDHIQRGKLNIVDWINMPGNFWEIAQITDNLKSHVGTGVAVAVLQKTRGKEFADGGEFSERLADLYFTIDFHGSYESRLTVGKIKEPKTRITGRSWAFCIVDNGANLHNIREVVKCNICWGKGWKKSGNSSTPCTDCNKTGYVDL